MIIIRKGYEKYLVSRQELSDMVVKSVKYDLVFNKSYVSSLIYPKGSISELTLRILNLYGYFRGYSDLNMLQCTL